ncbi:globin domain-containing protein [Streptomyces luteireticuli]|uniref:globin domain-containing protein n=1 Tax=Streptomyces luteireticuli TaxID=173858 RepID=UPI0035581C1E
MLSPKSTEIVRATLPAVGGAVGEITPLFYRKLFADRPELLRDLFNRGNQAVGSQQRALAGAFAAFATSLVEHPDTYPVTLLSRIAHKHASLGITADQYPLVHRHLFAAIAEVLGEAVTPEVAAAWDEVYWLMANALIELETRLYEQAGVPAGDVFTDCRVTGRRAETADVTTFTVRPLDGRPAPAARPGQYVSVQVALPDGARQIRQYSISGQPDGALQFSVKRDGEVSRHLHDHVGTDDVVRVGAPFGDVTLDEGDAPLLLASAGIGCTPMQGMLAHLVTTASERRVIAVHADRSEADHAFRDDLPLLVGKLANAEAHVWYERPAGAWPAERTGYADLSTLDVPAGTVAFLCGPLPFMRAVRGQLLEAGVAAADIHYEVFGPDLWLVAEG